MSESDSSELSESDATSDQYSSYSDESKKSKSWEDLNVEGGKSPSPLLCTTVSHHHDRERVDNFRVPAFESHTTVEWLKYNSLEALGLTLKDVLSASQPNRMVCSQPSAGDVIQGEKTERSTSRCSSSVTVSRLDVDLQLLRPFELRLERALELHTARRNWLLQGSRRVFGQLAGNRVAVLFEVSEHTCGLGQLKPYLETLQELLVDQLSRKKGIFMACVGSTVSSLWEHSVLVDDYRLQEAADWIQSLGSSPGCNVLAALKLALSHRREIDEITLVLGGRPDQDISLIVDHLAECLMGQQLPIHTVAYNCIETEILDFLKEISCLSGGTYHCHSETFPDGEDIDHLEREIQRVQNVIDYIKALKYNSREQTLSLLLKEVTDEGGFMSPQAKLSTVLTSPLILKTDKRRSKPQGSKEWMQSHCLKSLHLTLYQVLAPNSFSQKDGYCAIINKRVSAHIHDDHMAQLAWHDGSVKHVHVDPAQLEDYQRKLDDCIDFYKRRLDWLCSGSRRVFGTILEKRVILLLDTSFASLEELSRFQEHVRLLLEEQLSVVESFNLICFGSEATKWSPSLVEATTENLQEAWRWVLGWDFGGSCNLLSALRTAMEYEHNRELTNDPDAIYVVVSGHPDQQQIAVLSYISECLVGRDVHLHTIFYDPSSDARQLRPPGLVTTRYYDRQEMCHYLSCMAHAAGGRYHNYSENGCTESDDLKEICDEIGKSQNFRDKASMLLGRVDQIRQNRFVSKKDHTTTKTASRQPPREPRDTLASLARKHFIQSHSPRETDLVLDLKQSRPQSAPQPRYLTHAHFYTGYGNDKVMALDQVVLPKLRSFSLKVADIPKGEDRLSSKKWLKKFGLSKLHLNLDRLVAEMDSGHRTEHIATVNREAEALHCCSQPRVTIKGIERHLRLRTHELLDYETKLQRVIRRYEKRLQWLRSGSCGVFGSILEEQIVLLLDTSGTMAPSLHQLKLGVAALIWEQLHGNNIKFNIVRFSSEAVTWHERLVEPTEAACQSAVEFISQLKAEGGTDTLQALELSLKIPEVSAVYLVMNGKPERSTRAVLETVNRLNSDCQIPVHTVSFDCSDDVTNKFLKQLAHQTHGRFHRCVGENCGRKRLPDSSSQETSSERPVFEGDDLQGLAREIQKAKQFLAASKSYRDLLLQGKQKGESKQ